MNEPTSQAERELAATRAQLRDAEREAKGALRYPKWWESGDEIRKIILTLASVGALGGGGAFLAGRKTEPPPVAADPCTPEALRGVPRERMPLLCTRLEKLESDSATQNADTTLLKGVFGDLQREVKSVKPIVVKP